jgi:hypothetical protein
VIAASVGLLLLSVGLLTVGLVSGATPVLLASIGAALAALAPLIVAVVRAKPQGNTDGPRAPDGAAADPAHADPVAADPVATGSAGTGPGGADPAGSEPAATEPPGPAPDPPDPSTA